MEKIVDDARPPVIAVDTVKDIACGVDRQRGYFWTLAMSRDCGDTGSDEEGYCFELTQFVHHRIYFPGIGSLGVENGLSVVEDDEHLLGRKEGS